MISWPNPTSRTGIASAAWLPKLGCYFNVLTGTSSRSHCEAIFKILLQFNSKEMNEFIWKPHTNVHSSLRTPLPPQTINPVEAQDVPIFGIILAFLNKFILYDLSSNSFDSSNHISILYFVWNISHLLFIYMSPWNL